MIQAREYGEAEPLIALLHGGPGAPGYMAPVARHLGDFFHVLEPFQRGAGHEPLSVSRHVKDLHELLKFHQDESLPAIVGHSWGAMLALAYSAEYPHAVGALVLIGCGTFDHASRGRMDAVRRERMGDEYKRREARIAERYRNDPNGKLKAVGKLHQIIDSVKLISHKDESVPFDAQAHTESWADMMRLQDEGVYPAAFAAIRSPVLMLHGSEDPHPGTMIRDSLTPYLPQLEYHEWERCGHYPWLEEAAHEAFYEVLKEWLKRQFE